MDRLDNHPLAPPHPDRTQFADRKVLRNRAGALEIEQVSSMAE